VTKPKERSMKLMSLSIVLGTPTMAMARPPTSAAMAAQRAVAADEQMLTRRSTSVSTMRPTS
jgi:hypothetical protein